jgi:hypothetical protein
MTLTNHGQAEVGAEGNYPGKQVRLTQKGTFINNINSATIAGEVVEERQYLNQIIRPKADN